MSNSITIHIRNLRQFTASPRRHIYKCPHRRDIAIPVPEGIQGARLRRQVAALAIPHDYGSKQIEVAHRDLNVVDTVYYTL